MQKLTRSRPMNRIRYPDPTIKVNDTVKVELATGKITDFISFDTSVIAMVTGGRNMGRVGLITHRERHDGGFNIVHIKDAIDNTFATRETNVFVIGKEKPWIRYTQGGSILVNQTLTDYQFAEGQGGEVDDRRRERSSPSLCYRRTLDSGVRSLKRHGMTLKPWISQKLSH